MQSNNPLTYQEWCDKHEDEMTIKFAETGADREMCFDLEQSLCDEYDKYLETF